MERCSGGSTEMSETTPSSRAALHAAGGAGVVPSSPPPSYEHVLEETRLEAARAESERTAPSAASSRPQSVDEGGADEKATPPEQAAATPPLAVAKRQKILHKSSKELYRAVAAQWGITCKMSDHCRCLDCQSNYFDCEYDQNEQEKTDGGLGAGTPMFISEVMAGTACAIL